MILWLKFFFFNYYLCRLIIDNGCFAFIGYVKLILDQLA